MKLCDLIESSGSKRLKTLNGSVIKRSTKYGVGKPMGNAVYVHRQYEDRLPDISYYKEILVDKYPDFEYTVIKYSQGAVSFLYSPDFDRSHEPRISDYVTVKADGSTKKGTSKTIYHHKWLFVDDDYQGFNVEESFNRSKDWLQIPNIDFRRIGMSREYWLSFLRDNKEYLPTDFDFS